MLQIEIYIIIPDSRFPLCFSNAIQLHTYQHMYSYFTLLLIFHILPLSASFITNLGNPKPHYVGKKFKTNHQKNKHKNKKNKNQRKRHASMPVNAAVRAWLLNYISAYGPNGLP